MNDLSDLRGALTDHADGLGVDRPGRLEELHSRVRGARRRRRAVGGATVATVVVVAAAALLATSTSGGGPPAPADEVVGIAPPSVLTSLGFGYDLVDTVEGRHGQVHVRLDASDAPRLVSWATSGDDQRVRLRGGGLAAPLDAGSADFSDWVLVPEGSSSVLSVEAESGEPGLAVYAVGEGRPDGFTRDGATFADRTEAGQLVAAAIGAPGEAEVSTGAARAPGGTITVHSFCSSGSSGSSELVLNVATGSGGEEAQLACFPVPLVDGGSAGSSTYEVTAGSDLRTRAYVTRGFSGPVVDDPDVQVGVAVYDGSSVSREADGFVPSVDYAGHRYRLDSTLVVDAGGSGVSAPAPASDSPVLVVDRITGRGLSSVTDLDGSVTGSDADPTGLATEGRGLVSSGAPASLTLGLPRSMGGRGPQTLAAGQTAGLGFYVRAD